LQQEKRTVPWMRLEEIQDHPGTDLESLYGKKSSQFKGECSQRLLPYRGENLGKNLVVGTEKRFGRPLNQSLGESPEKDNRRIHLSPPGVVTPPQSSMQGKRMNRLRSRKKIRKEL